MNAIFLLSLNAVKLQAVFLKMLAENVFCTKLCFRIRLSFLEFYSQIGEGQLVTFTSNMNHTRGKFVDLQYVYPPFISRFCNEHPKLLEQQNLVCSFLVTHVMLGQLADCHHAVKQTRPLSFSTKRAAVSGDSLNSHLAYICMMKKRLNTVLLFPRACQVDAIQFFSFPDVPEPSDAVSKVENPFLDRIKGT